MRPRHTTHDPRKKQKKRIFWMSTMMMVLFVLSIFGMKASIPTALAMEQEARCGLEEHVHAEDCYLDNLIICHQKAHTHSNNCYLLLLEDNDINMLLTAVSKTEDKNLETLITGVLGEAVRLNDMAEEEAEEPIASSGMISASAEVAESAVMAASFSETAYAGAEVSQLNDIIDQFSLEPAMVLNESMVVPAAMAMNETSAGSRKYGVSAAAVEPNTSGMYLNIYASIDGDIVCIWSDKYTIISWGRAYKESDLAAVISDALAEYGLTAENYSMRYSVSGSELSEPTADTTKAPQVRNDSNIPHVVFGSGYTPVYLYLFDADGNAPLDFSTSVPEEPEVPIEPDPESITVDYNVNFSTDGYQHIQSVTEAVPGVLGESQMNVNVGEGILVCDVTDQNITVSLATGAARYGTVHFLGWKVGDTDTVIRPSSILEWDELSGFAVDGTVTLTGQWDYHMFRSVNFFMSYHQNASTNIESWTPVIFNTYVGGVDLSDNTSETNSAAYCGTVNPKYGINYEDPRDMEKKNLVMYDRQIRELHGESSTGAWLAEFPTDQYIFNELANYASQIYVEGEKVNVEDLNENHYTIQWIAFKSTSEGGPATWHVDGILVKKPGAFEITKTFAGNPMLIEAAKNGFYITATNGTETHRFDLENAISADPVNHVYKWKVEDVKYNEAWTVTENSPDVDNALKYHEWSIVDPNNTQNKMGTGTTADTVYGVTYPVDIENADLMKVNFNNIYYMKDSLILKKEDEKTGQALSGAEFELWQNGKRLTFDYNSTTGLFEYNIDGTGAYSVLSSDKDSGYVNISTTVSGFSFDNGDITVKEIKTPVGYGGISDIVLGKDSSGEIGIRSDSSDYARYNDGLLIIQNSSDPVDVTVTKTWMNYTNSDKLPVIVQLLANGDNALASGLVGDGSATVTLSYSDDETKSYTQTWSNLPVYANGEVINWSVREIQIGDEKCKADYSFANWIPAVTKLVDEDTVTGKENISLTVTNMPKAAAVLMLTKIDWNGTMFLPGAEFHLKNMSTGAVSTLTTDAGGQLVFYNLRYETRYELTEVTAPEGYWKLGTPVYFTIAGDGTILMEDPAPMEVTVDGKYSITVKNRSAMPMPDTGGEGTLLFTFGGMMLLMSVFTYYKKSKRKKSRREARRTSR